MMKSKQIAALILGLALSARAGVTFVQSYEEIGGKQPASTNTIRLDKDRVRVDAGTNPDAYFIYRGDKQLFWMVNTKDKTYMEMTEKDFEAMFAKMDEAMKKMQAQMENMPPEQKKMMEGMMAKMMPGGGKMSKTTYKKVGSGGAVNGWSTDKYEGTRDGAKASEIWTTAPKNVSIDEKDYQVLKDMAKFFEKFAKNLPQMIGDKSNGLEGIPVKTVSFKDGQPHFQTQMKEVKKESLAASLFEVPAGLALKKMGKPE
jgi:hypothetical protein